MTIAKTGARSRRKSGFALLITITLLAFLVLLLVSLASLTRVETQVASNNQQLTQARQNALMALNIAIGQLQKFTGPDQRTTARADMDSTLADVTNANGRWIGAYGDGAPVDTTYSLKPSQIPAPITANSNSKGSRAKLLNWLVSGNENTIFDPFSASTVGTDGHVATAPSAFAFTPTSAVNLATASATPATTDTQALLVGPKSAAAPSDYVAAPLVTINAAAGTVPGLTTAPPIGRYAWWVGDEGAKARVNIPMASSSQAPAAFVSARRAAIELVDGKNKVGSTNSTDLIGTTAYDPTLATLANVVSPEQLSLLNTAATALPAALQLRFHDLTASSMSVLADTYAGGLKKDLSALLATGVTSPADTATLFPTETNSSTDSYGVPTWGMLRSFAQTTTPSSGLDPRLPTSTDPGIYPVLTYAAVGMQYTAPSGDGLGNPIRLALFPIAVLWNPYTFPIKAAQYELGFNKTGQSPLQLQVAKTGTTSTWTVKETLDFNRGLAAITGGDKNADGSADVASTTMGVYESGYSYGTYVRFVIDTPDLPPGASLIFTLQGSEIGKDYNAPPNGKPANIMTNGLSQGYVFVNKGAVIGPGETGMNFRVGINYDPAYPADRTIFSPAPAPNPKVASMSGGEATVYLGQVSASPPIGTTTTASNDKKWYQVITRTSPAQDSTGGGNILHGRNALLQSSAPLSPVTGPTSVLSFFKTFTSANTIRWLAQGNPRAGNVTRTAGTGSDLLNQGGGLGMETAWQSFTADSTHLRASAGLGLNAGGGTASDATLFEVRPDTLPLLSLGQLQHANVSPLNVYPAYAIGNSLGDFRFKDNRDKVWVDQTALIAQGGVNAPTTSITSFYDLSWLLNRALWDRYFVSTVPHAGTGTAGDTNTTAIPDTLPDPRLERHGSPTTADLRDADKAATGLMLTGGFNINSTSEQAWRAVLGGVNRLPYNPVTGTSSATLQKAALARFSKPTQPPAVDNTQAWAWQGYRQLTDAQIAQLATNIVTEIRNRGPFVSLADFINRRLVDNPATTGDFANEQFKGTLQAAIDATYSGSSAVNSGDVTAYGAAGTNPFGSNTAPSYFTASLYDSDLLKGYAGTVRGTIPFGSISAFAPQFLTQADVLSVIGPSLSARSDTFTIRAYGEMINPVTQKIEGRAWCEAVVQRMPEYVDTSISADATPASGTINQQLGRRYKIVSFRWLSLNDI